MLEGYSANDIKLPVDEAVRMALKRTELITANTLLAALEAEPAPGERNLGRPAVNPGPGKRNDYSGGTGRRK